MNNKEKYRKALDQIHVREELKQDTLDKINGKTKRSSLKFVNYALGIVTVSLFAVVGIGVYNNVSIKDALDRNSVKPKVISKEQEDNFEKYGVKKFANLEELKEVLSKNNNRYYKNNEIAIEEKASEITNTITDSATTGENRGQAKQESYSKTNNQVENVDEADIIKTDGNYIYYCQNGQIYIVDSKSLEVKSEIKEKDEKFSPAEMFINEDKLIVLGNIYDESKTQKYRNYINEDNTDLICRCIIPNSDATVIVYDLKNIEEPKEIRRITLDGHYSNSRMIGDNIYFVSSCYLDYCEDLNTAIEDDLVPTYKDTCFSEEQRKVPVTDIAYFENSENYNYMLIAGFNLNEEKEVNVETIYGTGSDIYVSENNLYLVKQNYEREEGYSYRTSDIYKFKLENGTVKAVATGKVPGYVNNQFSIDEYNGNLRIATTLYEQEVIEEKYSETVTSVTKVSENQTNQITIFDENLNQIGVIENIEQGERIYSVRFMGDKRICCNI